VIAGRLSEVIRLFCKRALLKRLYFAKETYNSKEPTNRICSRARAEAIAKTRAKAKANARAKAKARVTARDSA